MSCPPKPGFTWQYLALLLAVCAAASGLALSRRDPDHRPAARALLVVVLTDVVRTALSFALPCEGPYAGADRVLFHTDQALYLLWPSVLAWLPMRVFCRLHEPRLLRWCITAAWGTAAGLAALLYPWLRAGALRQLYLGAELVALALAVGSIGAWVGRGEFARGAPPPAALVAALLVGVELAMLFFGPWPAGLFSAAYTAEQAALCVLYAVITAVQGGAWWTARTRSSSPS